MKKFRPNLIRAALVSSCLAFSLSSPVLAQDMPAEAESDVEVISVSGIRGITDAFTSGEDGQRVGGGGLIGGRHW